MHVWRRRAPLKPKPKPSSLRASSSEDQSDNKSCTIGSSSRQTAKKRLLETFGDGGRRASFRTYLLALVVLAVAARNVTLMRKANTDRGASSPTLSSDAGMVGFIPNGRRRRASAPPSAPPVAALDPGRCPTAAGRLFHQSSREEGGNDGTVATALLPGMRAIWVHSPMSDHVNTFEYLRHFVPARPVPLLRPGVDVVVLPGNHAPTREYWDFYSKAFRNGAVSEEQVVWTSGRSFVMDDDMDEVAVSQLVDIVKQDINATWLLIPYANTANFGAWAEPMVERLEEQWNVRISILRDEFDWIRRYGDKSLLHRRMDQFDRPSVIETIAADVPHGGAVAPIAVPRGYVCETVEELLAARRLLSDVGAERVCVKPLRAGTGFGIVLNATEEDLRTYDFPHDRPVSLEEMLDLDRDEHGEAISPAFHFVGRDVLGEDMVDQIMMGSTYSGWRRSIVSSEFQNEAERALRRFLDATGPCGPGGVDFLSVKGKPVLVDINTGRFNGAHPPKLFHLMMNQRSLSSTENAANCCSEMLCETVKFPVDMTVQRAWDKLKEAGLALVPHSDVGSGGGAFPITFMRGEKAQVVVLAENYSSASRMMTRVHQLFDGKK